MHNVHISSFTGPSFLRSFYHLVLIFREGPCCSSEDIQSLGLITYLYFMKKIFFKELKLISPLQVNNSYGSIKGANIINIVPLSVFFSVCVHKDCSLIVLSHT